MLVLNMQMRHYLIKYALICMKSVSQFLLIFFDIVHSNMQKKNIKQEICHNSENNIFSQFWVDYDVFYNQANYI